MFTIASGFITSCLPTSLKLPATAFAVLTLPDPASAPTMSVSFTLPGDLDSTKLYGAFLSGQEMLMVSPSDDGKSVSIPDTLHGAVYFIIATDADGVDGSRSISGPVLLEFSFDAIPGPQIMLSL